MNSPTTRRSTQDALDRAADLAVASREAAHEDAPRGQLQVGVGADDRRVIAAQLGVEGLHVLGGDAAEGDAGLDAAGECYQVDAVSGGEERADACAVAGDHLMCRWRQTAVFEDAGQAQQRQRTIAGRLADDRVAGTERRRDLVGVQLDRVVEGGDGSYHADGLADGDGHVPFRARHGVHGNLAAEEPLGLLAEAADDAGRRIHLLARLADGLAVLLGEHTRDVVALRHQSIRAGDEDAGPLMSGHPRHGPPTVLGRGHGASHVLPAGRGDRVDEGAGARVPNGDGGPVRGVAPFACDEHARHLALLASQIVQRVSG